MAKSVSYRRLPGGNPLFVDYIENFDRVRSFFQQDYRQPVGQWSHLNEIPHESRDDLVEGLTQDADKWGCRKQARKNIELLRNPDALVVITGQQVGLFGGPLYTYYKALSAVFWAQKVQKETGRATVPVFWMETSDHDFYEINHIRILDTKGDEVTLSLSHAPKEKRQVVGGLKFNGEIEKLIQRLWSLLPANTYRGPQMEMLSSLYRPGETFGDAFARLYSHHFGDEGLVIFDSENARCKKAVAPLLNHILAYSKKLNELLEESTRAVHRAGYPPQIQPQKNRLQLFIKIGEVKVPVRLDGALLVNGGPPQELGMEELRRHAQQHPENFLPKVSLRPILQDYLFPTAAYIGGPAEIAYFAQLKPLYEHLGVVMPAVIPRLSLTLIESKINKILEKYKITPEEFRQGSQKVINQYLESDSSDDLVGLFAKARRKWEEMDQELTLGLIAIDPTLQHPAEKTMERWLQGLEVLEEKARTALARKNETLVSQINKCCAHLAPGGNLQERRYNLHYYLARYGRALSHHIKSQAQIDLFRHQLIYLDEGD